jgi:hypothetical protein
MAISLGLIPSWQFSQDPAINIGLNPRMAFPVGMNQLTVQPINNVIPSGDGLGTPIARYLPKAVGVPGLGFFDSTWWVNRKWLALGILGVLGIGTAALAAKTLR